MIESIQEFASSFPDWLQWVGVLIASAIPFIDSYIGAVIGVAIGLNPAVAIIVAIIGNTLSMLGFVYFGSAIRAKATKNKEADAPLTPRRQKLKRAFDRFGVPGVSLLGPFILPSQFTSMAMVGFGANRRSVIIWEIIAIIVWGVAFGVLATLGINVALR